MRNQIIVCLSVIILLSIGQSSVLAKSETIFIGVWRSGNVIQKVFPESNNPNHVKQVAKNEGYNCVTDIEINVIGKTELSAFVWEKAPSACTERVGNWKYFVGEWESLSKQGYRLREIESYYQPANKERWYYGLYHKGSYGYHLWRADSWENFLAKWKELAKKNFQLVDIETYAQGFKRYYVGIWKEGKQRYPPMILRGWANFERKWKKLGKENYRLIDIESFEQGARRHYIGVWIYGTDGYYLWNVKKWPDFTKKFWELRKKNFKLIDLEILH